MTTPTTTPARDTPRPARRGLRAFLRVLLVLCALTWWVLPGMGLIDLGVTWDPDWPVMLEAGWGLLFTVGIGLPFLVVAVRPGLARPALLQLYVVTASLLVGVVAGLEPQSWWIFLGLALELPLVHLVARLEDAALSEAATGPGPARQVAVTPSRSLPLLTLAVAAAPVAVTYAWEMARLNRLSLLTSDLTNAVDHYSVQAALAVALVALPAAAAGPFGSTSPSSSTGFFGSAATPTRRLLGTSTALMAAYLGVVSYGWPGAAAGFSTAWSVVVVVWALAVLGTAWWPAKREESPGASGMA